VAAFTSLAPAALTVSGVTPSVLKLKVSDAMDPSKTKFPALASLPVTSVILFSDKYINYQNHTKYCPGYRVLLSTGKWGGKFVL